VNWTHDTCFTQEIRFADGRGGGAVTSMVLLDVVWMAEGYL